MIIEEINKKNKRTEHLIRCLDILICCVALTVLAPLYFVIGFGVWYSSGLPIIFSQKRVGKSGLEFSIYKFRSMTSSEQRTTVKQSHLEGHRLTKIGNFLRSSNFDELPQLINILRGEMSVVGPRPHELTQDREFTVDFELYKTRKLVRPGLTGWAQVNGYNGPITSTDFIKKRIILDIYWIEHLSLRLYFKIIVKTIFIGLKAFFNFQQNLPD